MFSAQSGVERTSVVVQDGRIVCISSGAACATGVDAHHIDLKGGGISPGLISFGSPLGLEEIDGEVTTSDGYVYDPLIGNPPAITGGKQSIIRAADGLQFATRNA